MINVRLAWLQEGPPGSEECGVRREMGAEGHSSDSDHGLGNEKQYLKFGHVPGHLSYMNQVGAHRHGHIQR